MKRADITVVIPSIPPRAALLQRAIQSVESQTIQPARTVTVVDEGKMGAAVTRSIGLDMVETEWVAFLDDDDQFLPWHLEALTLEQRESGADLVWPWFKVVGGTDPFPQHQGKQWNPKRPHQIPITVLCRTQILKQVGGFQTVPLASPPDEFGNRCGEDYNAWVAMSNVGAKFHHTPEVTWLWHHDSGNTSGLPSRW